MNSIGERIRSKRMANKMSMQELGNILGKSKGNISEYEKGKYEPSAKTIIALSRVFKVSTDWILIGEEYDHNSDEVLSEQEANLLTMYRRLDERDKRDIYDNVYCKYNRVYGISNNRVAEDPVEFDKYPANKGK